MYVDIQARKVNLDRTFEEWIGRRLWFALSRFGDRISRVSAMVEDINGPRGGVDQRCRIEVLLSPSVRIAAEATDVDAVLAVSRAADRISRRVRDAIGRRRSLRVRANKTRAAEIPSNLYDDQE